MKKLIATGITIALCGLLFAQEPEITFEKKIHNFGTIKEEDGKAVYDFEFTNTGDADLVLKNVQASCGCTTPSWTRTPVPPGEKGVITVSYSTIGRPGQFSKSITVTTTTEQREVLTIRGDVTKKPASIEERFPSKVDGLRFKSKFVNLDNIDKNERKVESIDFINTSQEEITVSSFNVKKHMEVHFFPSVIKPDSTGTLAVTFDAKKCNDYGPQNEQFGIILNKQKIDAPEYLFTVFGVVVEQFTEEQRKNPPVYELAKAIEFGEVLVNTKATAETTITNTGSAPLIIRKITFERADEKFISVSASQKPIAPGKSATIKVTLNAKDLPVGAKNNNLRLIVNEPKDNLKTIPVSYTIVEKK